MSSVTVFLLASSANGFEFNFLKDVKAQYEKTLKETEERQKNPEQYNEKLKAEWRQDIKDACTQAIKMMAVKYTDTPEEIKAKYDNANKIVQNVYKSFDALYKKQNQNIGYSNGGDTYYRNVRIGSPNTYLSSYLNMSFDTNGNVYYTSIDGKPSGNIEIDNEYYLESTYNLEPILEFYLYRIGGVYREQNRLQDAFNSAVKQLTSQYKNGLDNAYKTYQERQEKMILNNWYSIGVSQSDEIQLWSDANLSFEDAKKWAKIYNGKLDTATVLKLIKHGISLDDAKKWSELYKDVTYNSSSADSVLEWVKSGTTFEDAKKWLDLYKDAEYNVRPIEWINAGISLEDAKKWLDLYKYPNYNGNVMDWINAGISLEDAKKSLDSRKDTNYNSTTTKTEMDVSNMTFNSLAEKKAYIEQKKQEAEAQEKNKEAYDKKIRDAWIQELREAYTKAFKLMAIKNTDSLETLEQKYKDREKIVREVVKIFYDLALKNKPFMTYDEDRYKVFFRNTEIDYLSLTYNRGYSPLDIEVDSSGKLYYGDDGLNFNTDEEGKIIDGKIEHNYDFYTYQPSLPVEEYLEALQFKDGMKKFQEYNYKSHIESYAEEINKTFDTFEERQEKLKQKAIEAEKKAKIDKICNAWLKKAQKNNQSLKNGAEFRIKDGRKYTIYSKYKDTVDIAIPVNSGGTIVYLKESFNISSIIPESQFKTRPIPECGYGN